MENVTLPALCPNCAVHGATVVLRVAESAPQLGISGSREFVIAGRDVYKSQSGVGPLCVSLWRSQASSAEPGP